MRSRKDAHGSNILAIGVAKYERSVSGSAGSGVASRINALSSANGSSRYDDFLRIDFGGSGGDEEQDLLE